MFRFFDASVEKEVITATGDADPAVRLAALETLGRIGSSASVPVLVKTAAGDASDTQKAAKTALARVSGPGSDTAISKLAAEGDAKSRAVAIGALAARNDRASLPALLKYAAESDHAVSAAACAALGKLGTDNEIEGLARLALAGTPPGADAALQEVVGRARDKSAAAGKLIALVKTAQPQQMALLLETLTVLGGNDALAAISQSAASSNDEVKDAAIRALASWPDFAAVKPLLAIAADSNAKRAHSILAIQGVLRLAGSSDKEPAAARVDAALAAMNAATRDEDKKLALSALASVPDAKAANAIRPFLSDPQFKAEAGQAGLTLAEALLKSDKQAAKHLAQAVKDEDVSPELRARADAVLKK